MDRPIFLAANALFISSFSSLSHYVPEFRINFQDQTTESGHPTSQMFDLDLMNGSKELATVGWIRLETSKPLTN